MVMISSSSSSSTMTSVPLSSSTILYTRVVVLGLKLEFATRDPESLKGKIGVVEELFRAENSFTWV